MTRTILSAHDLDRLVTDLVAGGATVVAPVLVDEARTRTAYRRVQRLDEVTLAGPLPRRSLKELFLPASEVLLRYAQRKDGVDLEEVPTTFPRQVILGARPCDAAGVDILDRVMGWDDRDELWFGRRDATTIVAVACPGVDASCFCGALGLGPSSSRGADVLLVPLDAPEPHRRDPADGLADAVETYLRDSEPFTGAATAAARDPRRRLANRYLAEIVTPRGEALLDGRGEPAVDAADAESAAAFAKAAHDRVASNFAFAMGPPGADCAGLDGVPDWLATHFDHPLWSSVALRCHGCGTCAAVCPACHCFDIVDEHDTVERGCRRRNWDSCQFAKFTVHASGHNPRPTQTERFRQRVTHKFSIYPRRFGVALCTGCGRCARACAAGMSLLEVLGQIVTLAAPAETGSVR